MRSICIFLSLLMIFLCGAASAESQTEFITDIILEERPVQAEASAAPGQQAAADPSAPAVIESATISETAIAPEVYADIARGDKGDAVSNLQTRLIQLDYLAASETDGVYGQNTAAAMHAFKQACGIDEDDGHAPADCPATAQAQAVLFGDSAVPRNDSVFPVVLLKDVGLHAKESGSNLIISPEVKNESHARSVSSFTIECYATDIWGNRVFDVSAATTWTTVRTIAPGDKAQADAITLPDRNRIAKLFARITCVTFADGATLIPETQEYIEWLPVQW